MNGKAIKRLQYIEVGLAAKIARRTLTFYPIHTHDFFELELVLEGEGVQILNGAVVNLKRGVLTVMTPADYHSVEAKDGVTVINVAVSDSVLSDSIRSRLYSFGAACVDIAEDDIERFCRVAELMEVDRENGKRILLGIEYMLSIIPETPEESRIDPIQKAKIYADSHFREKITVKDGARIACLSSVYFGDLFKAKTGESYRAYVNNKRLTYAMALLEEGKSVSDACYESGFGSISNFAKAFKARYGSSPGSRRR